MPLVLRPSEATAQSAESPQVIAAMPGRISAIAVVAGQQVEKGETVVVLEAMKLLLRLPAPMSGRVGEIFCSVEQVVVAGTVLLHIEPAG